MQRDMTSHVRVGLYWMHNAAAFAAGPISTDAAHHSTSCYHCARTLKIDLAFRVKCNDVYGRRLESVTSYRKSN